MPEISSILVDLFVILLAAKVAGEVFERLGQPPVIRELLAGVLIGPHAFGLIGAPGAALVGAFHGDAGAAAEALRLVYHVLAELGVIVLLFYVGLETRVSDLLRVGPRALLVAVLGIALPFVFGLVFMVLQPTERLTDAFTAATLVEEPGFCLVLTVAKAGARIREHRTRARVSIEMILGQLRIHIPQQVVELPKGHVLVLDRGVPDDVEALEESAFLLTIASAWGE